MKEVSFGIDKDKLQVKIDEYIFSFNLKSVRENKFLDYYNVNLIISDIVLWIFKISSKLNISSILISNFTWVEVYKEYLNRKIWDNYIRCYKLADEALFYELYIKDMKDYIKKLWGNISML